MPSASTPSDVILIRGLALPCHIGVPEAERAAPQTLWMDAEIAPRVPFAAMNDDIARTVDYAAVCLRAAQIAAQRPRKLVETLASEIAEALVREFPASSASVELRKKALPETDCVAVRCVRML